MCDARLLQDAALDASATLMRLAVPPTFDVAQLNEELVLLAHELEAFRSTPCASSAVH